MVVHPPDVRKIRRPGETAAERKTALLVLVPSPYGLG
jgi:hypothetical protein